MNGECPPIRLVLYTDDALLEAGAMSVFSGLPQFHVLTAEPGLGSLVPFVEQVLPDVILVDFTPEMTLGLISVLRKVAPEAKLILWARTFSEELRYQARQIGVGGFIQRGVTKEEFAQNVIDMAGGAHHSVTEELAHSTTVFLTKREGQLVTLLTQGLRNKEIANCLGVTDGTVRIYLSKLFSKLGARDRFEVAVFGLKNSYCGQASWDGQNGFVTEPDEERARPVLRSLVLVEPQRRHGYARRAVAVGEVNDGGGTHFGRTASSRARFGLSKARPPPWLGTRGRHADVAAVSGSGFYHHRHLLRNFLAVDATECGAGGSELCRV